MNRNRNILLAIGIGLLLVESVTAQINSSSPTILFGSNTSYANGIMPSNLPSGGTYGASQDAANAYTAWKSAFVVTCTSGLRVEFDQTAYTVSEGIGYGMLLSAYAGDKTTFDGLWQYYKANENTNGLMNWKINGCSGVNGANGATDADEDAAMALIIASVQWSTATSPYTYKNEAETLITSIRLHEVYNSEVINGDGWGTGSTCRDPSYFAPAYYREFAKFDATNATFWTNCATEADNFLIANRNATTGLVSNWADNTGTPNSCNGNLEFGYDACRNPWRLTTDYLWHGATTAKAASDICTKMTNWIHGYEGNLEGPVLLTATNPTVGGAPDQAYKNGAFAPEGLVPMTNPSATSSTNQSSLNSCYTNIVNLGNTGATYFNTTIRVLVLFEMSGNFWQPSITPVVVKTALATAITTANNDYSAAVEGTSNGQYPTGSKATLETAITNATTVNTSTTETQAQVDTAVSVLDRAITTFTSSKIVVSKSALATEITTANNIYNAAVVGTGNGQFTDSSTIAFESAITTADAVFTSTTASQAQVNSAVAAVIAAVTTFQNAKISVSKTTLETDMAKADSIYTAAVEGTDNGQYPVSSKATLDTAITVATAVNTNASASQSQVDSADAALNAAVTTFQNSKIIVNKYALAAAILTANGINTAAVVGTENGQYADSSKVSLEMAIVAATTVDTSASSSQAQVDTAVKVLNAAVSSFENSVKTAIASIGQSSILVFPNPCQTTLHIAGDEEIATVSIVSLQGVVQQSFKAKATEITISVASVPQGVYLLLVIYSDGTVATHKISKL